MRLNVAQLLKQPIGSSRTLDLDERIDSSSDEEGPRSVRGRVSLVRTDKGVLVTGNLETEVAAVCARCLKQFNYRIRLDIEEEYFPTVDVNTGLTLPRPEESGAFVIDAHHTIDLSEAVRQYALTAMPIKPLCRKDCAGLCPACGRNLNEGPCGCESVSTKYFRLALPAFREGPN